MHHRFYYILLKKRQWFDRIFLLPVKYPTIGVNIMFVGCEGAG